MLWGPLICLASIPVGIRLFFSPSGLHQPADTERPRTLAFRLDGDHASRIQEPGPEIVIQDHPSLLERPTVTIKTRPTSVFKPRSVEAFMHARHSLEDMNVEWDEVDSEGPDIEDRHTIQQLAMMSGNAYALPGQKNWYDLDGAWNEVSWL